jgi:osmotically-inducible protein OsmY
MRRERETPPDERRPQGGAVRGLGRARDRRADEALASGRYAEPRSWLNRTRDEVAAWFGDTGAMRRRQWDEASGDHSGQGPTQVIDADACIVETLNHRLTIDPEVDATDVRVACNDGVVTLEGSVRTSAGVQHVDGLAIGVSGVKSVVNKLTVA